MFDNDVVIPFWPFFYDPFFSSSHDMHGGLW